MQKYSDLIRNSAAFRLLDEEAQAQLICTKDSVAALLLARLFIESVTGRSSHTDIMELPLDGGKVTVSDIDELTKTALLTPVELKCKYYIIKNGETMNDAASNKLLKTLEEPPPAVRIIIICQDEGSVFPTVLSRCRVVRAEPFSALALNEIVDRFFCQSPYAFMAKELHLGSITRLERAVAGHYSPLLDVVCDCLLYMKKSGQIFVHAQRLIACKDDMGDIIDLFELVLHDAMKLSLKEPLSLSHRRADITEIAAFYSADVILRLGGALSRARQRLDAYGNTNSIIDELLFSLLEIRQKCQSPA